MEGGQREGGRQKGESEREKERAWERRGGGRKLVSKLVLYKPSQPQRIISGLRETFVERLLVSWCFKPSQPQRITSGLIVERHTVERTNKAALRPGEQSKKAKSCRENEWNKIQLKAP